MKETEEDTNKLKDASCLQIGGIYILKISSDPNQSAALLQSLPKYQIVFSQKKNKEY